MSRLGTEMLISHFLEMTRVRFFQVNHSFLERKLVFKFVFQLYGVCILRVVVVSEIYSTD